jgi:broad specificity phosphatase PhoE
VRRAFAEPDEPAWPGWEPLAVTRDRLLPAVRRILGETPGEDVVLCGHGTAWTLLVSELTGRPPDLDAWSRLRMPDLWCVDVPTA